MSLFLPEDASAIKISVTFKLNEGKCSLKKTEMFQEGLEQMMPGTNIKMQVSRLEPELRVEVFFQIWSTQQAKHREPKAFCSSLNSVLHFFLLAMSLVTIISDLRISLWHPHSLARKALILCFVCNTLNKFSIKSTILFANLIPSFSSSFYLSLLSFLTCSSLSDASLKNLLTFYADSIVKGLFLFSFHTSAAPMDAVRSALPSVPKQKG